MSARGTTASGGSKSGVPVLKLRSRTGWRGPAYGLRPVCWASIWYIGSPATAELAGLPGAGEAAATARAPGDGEGTATAGATDGAAAEPTDGAATGAAFGAAEAAGWLARTSHLAGRS